MLDPEVVAQLLVARRVDPLDRLTRRERDVLALMAEGRSNAAIAERLVVTGGAVEKHISSIFAKIDLPDLGADNRRVLAVLTWGLTDKYTWLNGEGSRPDHLPERCLPFDAELKPVPAYSGMLSALRSAPRRA